jgi:ABC-type transport system substrate-binding protein
MPLAFLVSQKTSGTPINIPKINQIDCTARSSSGINLEILGPREQTGVSLLPFLCDWDNVQPGIKSVKYTWFESESTLVRKARAGDYSLAWGGAHIFEDYVTNSLVGYVPIAENPSYDVFFIFREEIGNLERLDIGLLSSTKSRSGYLSPMAYLNDQGFNAKNLHIKRYSSHAALRFALESGEVDVIGSYWSEDDEEDWPQFKTLSIASKVAGYKWYLHPKFLNTELHCKLQQTLSAFAQANDDSYFSDLEILNRCLL